MTENEPLRQLRAAGYERYLRNVVLTEHTVAATADLELVERLCADPRFKQGIFYRLHRDTGDGRNLTEFRSIRGLLMKDGSVQVVMDRDTGELYADCDRRSPYDDLVGVFGHGVGEVLWPKLKGVGRKIRRWFS